VLEATTTVASRSRTAPTRSPRSRRFPVADDLLAERGFNGVTIERHLIHASDR